KKSRTKSWCVQSPGNHTQRPKPTSVDSLREVAAMEAVMRYCVQPATAEDVALLAIAMENVDDIEASDCDSPESGEHLVNAFLTSTHVWAARNQQNQPVTLVERRAA